MAEVILSIEKQIAVITIDNQKKLNALTLSMIEQLASYCDELEKNRNIRCVILQAVGDKAFCVGADIKEWSSLSPFDFSRHWVRYGHQLFDKLARLSHPTIAVLNGHTFGGGLELAAACDIRVSNPEAMLGLPESSVGVVPGWSGTQRIKRLLPEGVLKEMVLFARKVSAQKAYDLGFIAEISDTPMAAAINIAEKACGLSTLSTEISKYMIHAGAGEDSPALIEALGSGMIAAQDDVREGVLAFKEKRKPNF